MMMAMTVVPSVTPAGQARMLAALQAVTRQVAANTNLADLLAMAADTMHATLGYEQAAIYLTHPETGQLTLCAVAGVVSSAIPASNYYLSPETSTPGQAVRCGRAISLGQAERFPGLKPALGIARTATELSVPICEETQAIGELTVGAARSGCLGTDDEEQLALFAEQLAAAMRSAELFRRAAEREASDALLMHISHVINGSLDSGQVLAQAVAVVGEQLKVDRCTLGRMNLRTRTYVTEHEYVNPLLFERRSLKRPLPFSDALDEVMRRLQTGEVLIGTGQVPDSLPPVLWNQLSQRYGVRSLAWVPIPSGGQDSFYALQLMQVTFGRPWHSEDIILLRRLADQLAIALRNAEILDATERNAAALRDKNAELETFVYTVSHDLQAAVASLGGFAALLKTHYQTRLDERGNLYVARIAVNADYLDRMLRFLLKLSRVGRAEEPDEVVPVGAVVEDVLSDLAQPLAERKVKLAVPPAWPLVRYSRLRLREVFSNLLSNAYKFLGPQPQPAIEVGWRRLSNGVSAEPTEADAAALQRPHSYPPAQGVNGGLIEFSVKDNGIGIDESDQQRIFLPFQRLQKVNVEGTGVGLSIVKRIVEGRGGTVRIASTPGRGAAFFFTIPAAAETDELTSLGSEGPLP